MLQSSNINHRSLWTVAAGALLALATACNAYNPLFCQGHPSDPACADATVACNSNAQCTSPKPVCDLIGNKICVQCTTADVAACMGMTPICGTDDQCRGCQADSECTASQTCDVTSGQCLDPGAVLYVSTTGVGNSCSLTQPCGQITTALGQVTSDRKAIKLLPGSYTERVIIADTTVTIHGAGADLTETMAGEILRVQGSANVSLLGLRIHDGLGGAGDGILCTNMASNNPVLALQHVTIDKNGGLGLNITKCTVTASQSTVSGNTSGGISVSGAQFDITNSFIVGNGGGGSVFGGVKIDSIGTNAPPPHRLDFNTITANLGPVAANLGIQCGTVLTPLTFSSNIIYANVVSGAGQQIAGTGCTASYSDVGPDTDVDAPAGMSNINTDPLFVDPANGNFHLMSSSPAKDAADPAATLNIDFDGDARPQGTRRDIGADEIKP